MIYVKRRSPPDSINGVESKGGVECQKARQAYADGKEFKAFKVYKSEDVVEALRSMFNCKCAYCEFNYSAGGPEDVEHFRPKGAVVIDGAMETPGYYWLASEWTNLLPSCLDCNRARKKLFIDGTRRITGKANHFPIKNEDRRWRDPQAPCEEECLLINPCEVDPDIHLEFLEKGLIRAKLDERGVESDVGKETIEIFGLRRHSLVTERACVDRRVRVFLDRALLACQHAGGAPSERERKIWESFARDHLESAKAYLEPSRPFHAVVRTIFKEYGL